MFFSLKYEQNELSYMKICQQIRKLVFSPPRPGVAFLQGVKKGVPVVLKIEPQFHGLMDP